MVQELTAAYTTIAKEVEVKRIIPVGRAFQEARNDAGWCLVVPDPKFDYSKPVFPNLPRQQHSLNVGWRWKADKKFSFDGHHANAWGEYLAVAVWFEFFLGKDVRGNAFLPPGLTKEDATLLQKIAHRAMEENEFLKKP